MTDRIGRPGMYDLTAEEYHGDCCVEPSVSKTGLAMLLGECPAKFYATAPFNPHATPRPQKRVWDIGNAVHELILVGEHEFYSRNKVLPEGIDLRHREGKRLKAQAEEEGLRLLSHQDGQMITAMHAAFQAHPLAPIPFMRGLPERSLIWKDAETGVWLKVRPDFLPDRIGIVPDYKSARSAAREQFRRDVFNYGYHLQAALYLWGIKAVLDETPDDFIFVVQEKEPPYLIGLYSLDEEWLDWARIQLRKAIRLFADCLERNHWPGYGEEVDRLDMPRWASSQLQDAHERGEFEIAA